MINQVPTDTRWRLIEAALHLFREKGYGSTSIADILSRASVNSGSLYQFFPGRQDLVIAVLGTCIAGIDQMLLEPAWRGVHDPIEKRLEEAGPRLPTDLDRRAVAELRNYFNRLLRPARSPARRRPQRRKKGKSNA
ncbi:MAG: TetR/AcrR family transcriptional regulator [Gammaproteobacteria bacterium]